MPFTNPLALLGLLSIVPLIILYMIRPKPRDLPFSSTAFIIEEEAKPTASINRLVTDRLFWIQLLVIALLAISAAGPFVVAKGTQGDHLVIVMDLSASMEASFDDARGVADQYVSDYDRISIVLAENVPVVALREGNRPQAEGVLASIQPRAVSADLSAGITMAKGLMGAEGGNILVISDFISWTGDNPEVTRNLIENGDVEIAFIDTGKSGENVGIVNGWIVESSGSFNYSCLIRNFGKTRVVPIEVRGPGGTSTTTRTIDSGGDSYFSFDAFSGVNTISLKIDDAISADNVAYIYVPEERQRKVLYLGDEGPALAALESLPQVSTFRSGDYRNFDLVVIANDLEDGEMNRYVYGGGRVVYMGKNATFSPDYLPVRVTGEVNESYPLWVRNPEFAKDIHFDEIGVFGYLNAVPRADSVTMVEANGVPVISYWRLGSGTALYMGLTETDFYQRPEYPVFWYKMVNWLTEVPDASESNRRTGEVLRLGEVTEVDAPGGRISTDTLLLDRVGVYRFQGKTLVANMYNARESELKGKESLTQGGFTTREASQKLVERELSPWLILLIAGLVGLEMIVIWRRREA